MAGYPFLKSNIDYFKEQGHPVYDWLSTTKFDEEQLRERIGENKFGMVDWTMDNGQTLFEQMPPFTFYETWEPDQEKAHTSASIIVGCNLGYGVNHLLVNTPDSHKVIVLEPRPEMVMASLGQTDYIPFLKSKKLHFCLPDEQYLYQVIKNLDLQYIYGRIHLRVDMPSSQMGPEYARWGRIVKHKLENFTVELATLRHRQDDMVGHELENFKRARNDGSLLPLAGRGKEMGAVILGAGPSLAEFAPELKKDPGNVLYTTALQTMPALQKYGIKPHFCLAIDYTENMLKVYDRLVPEFAQDVPFIYSTKCDPRLVKNYPGPTIPLWTLGGLGTFVMQGQDLVLDAGGNVSLTLTRLLRWMNVSHMVLVGQDFAWKGETSHISGHHADNAKRKFDGHRFQRIKNAYGEELTTAVQYTTSLREMEQDIAKDTIPVFNLYGGGAVIQGTHMVTLDEARKKGLFASAPGTVNAFTSMLEHCRRPAGHIRLTPRSHEWASSFRHVEKRLGKLFKKVGANQEEIHKTMNQVELFLKHEPLYIPYLFNETLDMAGLTRAKSKYEPRDLGEFRRIVKNVLRKVRQVDRLVCTDDNQAAA